MTDSIVSKEMSRGRLAEGGGEKVAVGFSDENCGEVVRRVECS